MPAARNNNSTEAAERKSGGRKPTLSPTRINTYLECAVKYKYIYQDKIGRFYTKARAGYSFGSTLHNVLQDFHEQGAAHTPEEMVEELQQKWIGAGYESQEQEQAQREAGQQIVQAYHAAHQERVQAQVETIATEKTLSCDMGRFKLSGRVDRIDRHADGRLEIIDYKSGRWDTSAGRGRQQPGDVLLSTDSQAAASRCARLRHDLLPAVGQSGDGGVGR